MQQKRFAIFPILLTAILAGCGSDGGTSAGESSSSESSSSESSSSYSNRLDVVYADTLASDTVSLSGKGSELSYKLFLGEFPRGTLIGLSAKKVSGGAPDTLSIREEQGQILVPEIFTVENGDTLYDTRATGLQTGDTAFSSARFITTRESGFYYVDVPKVNAGKDSSFEIELFASIEPGRYLYADSVDSIGIRPGDTVRGFFILENFPEESRIAFSATVGKSVNVNAFGKAIENIVLQRNGETVASGTLIDAQILPEKNAEYTIAVRPKGAPDYTTGPYAYFEIQTSARELVKGEYLANPDSIVSVGDTLVVVREKNDAAKYYLRQEQYVYLANLEKGDSIQVFHEIEGYYSGASYPATYTILDSAGDSIARISETQNLFVAKEKGPHYLHYVRLNSPPKTQSQILTLKTMVQRFGYVTGFSFYDEERDEAFTTKSVQSGDTLHFSKLHLRVEPANASGNALWYVPCGDLALIQSAYTENNCKNYGREQLIGATNIAITTDASRVGEIIRLIAQSVADPHARDTLSVFISDAGTP